MNRQIGLGGFVPRADGKGWVDVYDPAASPLFLCERTGDCSWAAGAVRARQAAEDAAAVYTSNARVAAGLTTGLWVPQDGKAGVAALAVQVAIAKGNATQLAAEKQQAELSRSLIEGWNGALPGKLTRGSAVVADNPARQIEQTGGALTTDGESSGLPTWAYVLGGVVIVGAAVWLGRK